MPILRYPFNSNRTYRIGLTRTYSDNAVTILVNDFFGATGNSTTPIGVGGGSISISGSDIISSLFKMVSGNGILLPMGALAKRTLKPLSGLITSSASISRVAQKNYGQATLSPTTGLTEDLHAGVTFGGGTITPSGTTRKMVIKLLGGGVVNSSGTIVRNISKMLYGTILATIRIPMFITRSLGTAILNMNASSIVGDIVEEIIEIPTRLNRILYSLKDSFKR